MITLALVPIAPGRACKDIPNITSHTAGGETTWILPVAEGALHFVCTPESCSVVNQ
jgi:hypothetical protein